MDPKGWPTSGQNVCRCCLAEGCYKDISTEYFWMGKREVYSDMLNETFDVNISFSKSGSTNSRLICEPCISRLRDASEFKKQVVDCERMFMNHLSEPGSSTMAEPLSTLTPDDVKVIKVEAVKQEKDSDGDEDFADTTDFLDDDDDDEDDLDNQPLTKFATKVPKKEAVDIMDLLDNTELTIKRKAPTKTKAVPAKKAKTTTKVTAKATVSKAKTAQRPKTAAATKAVVEKKKKGTTIEDEIETGKSIKAIWIRKYGMVDDATRKEVKGRNEKAPKRKKDVKPKVVWKKNSLGSKGQPGASDTAQKRVAWIRKYKTIDTETNSENELIKIEPKLGEPKSDGKLDEPESNKDEPKGSNKPKITWRKNRGNAFIYAQHTNAVPFKYKQGRFMCVTCCDTFPDVNNLRTHYIVHEKLEFVRLKSRVTYPLKIDITDLKCTICDNPIPKFEDLKPHLLGHGEVLGENDGVVPMLLTGTELKCTQCSDTFENYKSLLMHNNVHYENFICPLCGKGFYTQHCFKGHLKRHEGTKGCHTCGSKISNIKEHKCTKRGRSRCPICGEYFTSHHSRQRHLVNVHGQKSEYKCNFCAAVFVSATFRYAHVKRVHEGLKRTKKRKKTAQVVSQSLP